MQPSKTKKKNQKTTKQKQPKTKVITTTKNIYLLLNKCVTYSKTMQKKRRKKNTKN